MEALFLAASCLWLGILTSVSPCPLATNIAAVSYIARDVGSPRRVLASGMLYTAGRAAAYTALAAILVMSLLSAPWLSHILQSHMGKIMGPVLVLTGMVLLGLIPLRGLPNFDVGALRRRSGRVGGVGAGGAAAMGFLFALSFCPVSAAFFFGSLLPLAVANDSRVVLPVVYGVGTALPVVAVAIAISVGVRGLGRIYERTVGVERWLRRAAGITFVAVGIYLSLANIFRVVG